MRTFILCTFLAFCSHISFGQDLTITIYNKTGKKVEEFRIGNKLIGTLPVDWQTKKITFNSVRYRNGLREKLLGFVDGEYIVGYGEPERCSTGPVNLRTEGDLVYDLVIYERHDGQYLSLLRHSEE